MICKTCGQPLPENSKFCIYCGALAEEMEQKTEMPSTTETSVPPQVPDEALEQKTAEDASLDEWVAAAPVLEPQNNEKISSAKEQPSFGGEEGPVLVLEPDLYGDAAVPEEQEASAEAGKEENVPADGETAAPFAQRSGDYSTEENPLSGAQPQYPAASNAPKQQQSQPQEPIYARGFSQPTTQPPLRPAAPPPRLGSQQPGPNPARSASWQSDPAPAREPIYPTQAPQPQEEMSMGEWVRILLLTLIPIVNIVLLCVWAFDSTSRPTKRNWARAQLIVAAVAAVIALVVGVGLMLILPFFIIAGGQLFL